MWGGKRVLIFFATRRRKKKKKTFYIIYHDMWESSTYNIKKIAKAELLVTVYKYPLSYF